ncbi:MAG: hypothetical protein ACTHOO_10045 [Alcanivorax sp.]
MTTANPHKKTLFSRFKKPSKQMFWAWIAYQTIKGSLTTMFIWLPLIWYWLGYGGQ